MAGINGQKDSPTLDLNFAKNKSLIDTMTGRNLVTFSRTQTGNGATYVGADGLIKYAVADEPRFDHDPETGECLGLLIEESRTNFLTQSEHLDSGWVYQGGDGLAPTVTSVEAPDGGLDSRLYTLSPMRVRQDKTVPAAVYTLSVYYKPNATTILQVFLFNSAVQANVTFDTTNPNNPAVASGRGEIVNVGNGWYRASVTTLTATNGTVCETMIYPNGGYLWGAQLEAGSFPTSYIPTEGGTKTRSADVASITGSNFSSWYNESASTLFISSPNFPNYARLSNGTFVYISDAAAFNLGQGNGIKFGTGSPSTDTRLQVTESSVLQADIRTTQCSKIAIALASNDLSLVADGVSRGTDTSVNIATGLDRLVITSYGSGYAHLSRLTYWPERLSNKVLQRLTR